ncbi:MAG: substrate-binding domain-containing protein [Thomasclavelia sp.]
MVFCGYDKDGVAVINAAQENGIKIPEEMEVVGMLNTSYSIMCETCFIVFKCVLACI